MINPGIQDASALIQGLDPRFRVCAACSFSLVAALVSSISALGTSLAAACVLLTLSRLPIRQVVKRLIPLNLIVLALAVMLELGAAFAGDFNFFRGIEQGVLLLLKANAIAMCLAALIGTLSILELGHAFWRLGMPAKMTYLFLLTFRYLDVFQRELERLLTAMRARAFQPRMNMHTLRTTGYLIGMLVVRAFDRSDRIQDAMRCRGFQGRFPVLTDYQTGAKDWIFALSWSVLLMIIVTGNLL